MAMVAVKKLLHATYGYFARSPKWHPKMKALLEELMTRGLKLLQNCEAGCVGILASLQRLVS